MNKPRQQAERVRLGYCFSVCNNINKLKIILKMHTQKIPFDISKTLKSFSQQKLKNHIVRPLCIRLMHIIKTAITAHVVTVSQKPYLMALFMQASSITSLRL